jgi:peptide/nickel transport system substrate-binding protein
LNGTIPDGIPYHDKSLNNELPVQDLDLAKFLFERIGWQGTITIPYKPPSGIELGSEIEIAALEENIEKLGVDIDIVLEPINTDPFDSQIPLYAIFWGPDYFDPDNFVNTLLSSSGLFPPALPYENEDIDIKIQQAKQELDDTKRAKLYQEIEILANDDFPYIYVHQERALRIIHDNVKGLEFFSANIMGPQGAILRAPAMAFWELCKESVDHPCGNSDKPYNPYDVPNAPEFEWGLIILAAIPVIIIVAISVKKLRQV